MIWELSHLFFHGRSSMYLQKVDWFGKRFLIDLHIWTNIFFSRLPFNWKTPYTYPIAVAFFAALGFISSTSVIPMMIFFVGSFILFIAFIKDILNDLNDLNGLMKKSRKDERMQLFCKIIKDSSSVKQLSKRSSFYIFHNNDGISTLCRFLSAFNDIAEFSMAILFAWSLLSICVVLLTLQSVLVREIEITRLYQHSLPANAQSLHSF